MHMIMNLTRQIMKTSMSTGTFSAGMRATMGKRTRLIHYLIKQMIISTLDSSITRKTMHVSNIQQILR